MNKFTAAESGFDRNINYTYTMQVPTTKQIKASLKAVANWSQSAQTICRTFKFEGFLDSIAFVKHITLIAQNLNHYPDIDIRFDQVTLTLTTHDAGEITEKDFSVARQCDEVFLRFFHFDQCRLPAKTRRSERNGNKDMVFAKCAATSSDKSD